MHWPRVPVAQAVIESLVVGVVEALPAVRLQLRAGHLKIACCSPSAANRTVRIYRCQFWVMPPYF